MADVTVYCYPKVAMADVTVKHFLILLTFNLVVKKW